MKNRATGADVLMTGDLSNLPVSVIEALRTRYGHHRTAWFENLLRSLVDRFSALFGPSYRVLLITATRRQALQALDENFIVPEETASSLSIVSGVTEYGKTVDLPKTVQNIRNVDPGALVVVDLSDTFGSDPFDPEKVGADGYLIIPERALMGVPGVCVLVLNDRSIKALRSRRPRLRKIPYALDLLKYLSALENSTTPFSPNISASVALQESLRLIDLSGGMQASIQRHSISAALLRDQLTEWGFVCKSAGMTNAFTVCDSPPRIPHQTIRKELLERGIIISSIPDGRLKIGHCGYFNSGLWNRAFEAFHDALSMTSESAFSPPLRVDNKNLELTDTPSIEKPFDGIFTIEPEEFIQTAHKRASRHSSEREVLEEISRSTKLIFRSSYSSSDLFPERRIGFIGAGNIVRHAVELCRKIGLKNITVYSPSLAKMKGESREDGDPSDHKNLQYWHERGVEVSSAPLEVFINCHTVVLLPFVYTKEAVSLFKKDPEYHNIGMVNGDLLDRVEKEGAMDTLINASAREALIDREALANHIRKGWIRYFSDEMPDADDPVFLTKQAHFTAHVGGSCRAPQERVAQNTHVILKEVVTAMHRRAPLMQRTSGGYVLNVINELIDGPKPTWRYPNALEKGAPRIRILLTDSFDVAKLDFPGLSASGVEVEVRDLAATQEHQPLKEIIRNFRPHILLIRSQTKIGPDVVMAAKEVPELSVIVRPGVGVDNLYDSLPDLNALGVAVINEPYGNSFAVAEMTMHFILNATERLLLTPGPTRFLRKIFDIGNRYTHPSAPRYMEEKEELTRTMRQSLDVAAEDVFAIVSGPSTYCMEAAVERTTEAGSRGLVISHGKFGIRFKDIARNLGRNVELLEMSEERWGEAFSPEEVADKLSEDAKNNPGVPLAFLCFQQNETSSGVAYHSHAIRKIAAAARHHNPDIVIIMDAVSGAFAHSLPFSDLEVDAAVVGSQKAVGISSGLTFVFFSQRCSSKKVRQWIEAEQSDMESVFHVLSAHNSMNEMEDEGGAAAVIERHRTMAERCREALHAMGLRILTKPEYASNAVTPFLLPPGIDASSFRKQLEAQYGIVIAGAQAAYWKPSLARMGTVGFVYSREITQALRAMRILLQKKTT